MYTTTEITYISNVFSAFEELGFPRLDLVEENAPHPGVLNLMVEIYKGDTRYDEVLCLGVIMPMAGKPNELVGKEYIFSPSTYHTKPMRTPGLGFDENYSHGFLTSHLSEKEYSYVLRAYMMLKSLSYTYPDGEIFNVEVTVKKPILDEEGKHVDDVDITHLVTNGDHVDIVEPKFYADK